MLSIAPQPTHLEDTPTFRFVSVPENQQPLHPPPVPATSRPTTINSLHVVNEYLTKWGFTPNHSYFKRFSYEPGFSPDQDLSAFIGCFLTDANVTSQLRVVTTLDTLISDPCAFNACNWTAVPLSVEYSDLTLFDGLYENGVVRQNGHILKCLDDDYSPTTVQTEPARLLLHQEPGDTLLCDVLHQALINPNYELFDRVFKDRDRSELLFHLFTRLVLGGRVNQFEDEIGPYLHVTKAIYKEMISVTRGDSGIRLHGYAYSILPADGALKHIFPHRHRQNFLILVINPISQSVTVWYHASPSFYT